MSGEATALLARALAAGLALRIADGRLVVKGPKPPDDLLAALRAGRDDLIRAALASLFAAGIRVATCRTPRRDDGARDHDRGDSDEALNRVSGSAVSRAPVTTAPAC